MTARRKQEKMTRIGKKNPLQLKTMTRRASATRSLILGSIFDRRWSLLKLSEKNSICSPLLHDTVVARRY
jgi:hypothetical protein